jgi:hypothetical protein
MYCMSLSHRFLRIPSIWTLPSLPLTLSLQYVGCVYRGVNISTTQSSLRIIPSFSSADYSYSLQRNKPHFPYSVTSMPNPGYVDAVAPVIPRHDHQKLYSHSKIIQTSTFGLLFTTRIDNYIWLGDISKQPHVKEVMRTRIKDCLSQERRLTEHESSWPYW